MWHKKQKVINIILKSKTQTSLRIKVLKSNQLVSQDTPFQLYQSNA
jgi:hypothetical protein